MKTGFINGKIYTMEAENDVCEAFSVLNDKFYQVGSNKEILNDECDEIVDLSGGIVLPGFIDSHLHILASGKNLNTVNLRNASSVKEVKELLSEEIKKKPKGCWIRGMNFDHERFEDKMLPTKEDLDEVSIDHPILISRYCLHAHVANSLALELGGIDRNFKPETENAMIVDENGEPNGILWETAVTPVLKRFRGLLIIAKKKRL